MDHRLMLYSILFYLLLPMLLLDKPNEMTKLDSSTLKQISEMFSCDPHTTDDVQIPPDRNCVFRFLPNARDRIMNITIEFAICRLMGMSAFWQTMFILPDKIEGDIIAFNTNHQLPTFATVANLQ